MDPTEWKKANVVPVRKSVFVSISSNIVFKIHLTQSAAVVMINDIETTAHFLLHCRNFSNERSTFLNIIVTIDRNILTRSDSKIQTI